MDCDTQQGTVRVEASAGQGPGEGDGRFWAKVCFVYVGLVILLAAGTFLTIPCQVNTDSAWGFAVWHSMKQGGPFNCLVQPDPSDLSVDRARFLSTWSPGQYLVPGFLELTGLPLRVAIVLTSAAFSAVGALFLYKLYRFLGFDPRIASISCCCLASQRFFMLPFGIYNGGEVLLFGGGPVILYFALKYFKGGPLSAVMLALGFLGGFILKNASMILALALCISLAWRQLAAEGPGWKWFRTACALTFAFGVAWLASYYYNTREWSPRSYQIALPADYGARFFFTLGGVFTSTFTLGDLLSFLLNHPGRTLLHTNWQAHLLIVIPVAVIGMITVIWVLVNNHRAYRRLVVPFVLVYLTVFLALNLTNSPVTSNTDERHYRLVGLLLLPGFFQAIRTTGLRSVAVIGAGLVFVSGMYGWSSLVNRAWYQGHQAVGRSGLCFPSADPQSLQLLHSLDRAAEGHKAIFYLTSPDTVLELENSRSLLTHQDVVPAGVPADMLSAEVLALGRYKGRVQHLYVVLPERFDKNGKTEAILNCFVDVAAWGCFRAGGWKFYYPVKFVG
jgi:hypothetical protein